MKNAILIALMITLLIPFGVSAQDSDECADELQTLMNTESGSAAERAAAQVYGLCVKTHIIGNSADGLSDHPAQGWENPYVGISLGGVITYFKQNRMNSDCPVGTETLVSFEDQVEILGLPGQEVIVELCFGDSIEAVIIGKVLIEGVSFQEQNSWNDSIATTGTPFAFCEADSCLFVGWDTESGIPSQIIPLDMEVTYLRYRIE